MTERPTGVFRAVVPGELAVRLPDGLLFLFRADLLRLLWLLAGEESLPLEAGGVVFLHAAVSQRQIARPVVGSSALRADHDIRLVGERSAAYRA